MDSQTIGFIITLIAILVNIGALAWNIRKTSIQNEETKKLTELTAQLDVRVHRLSAGLNQRIAHLNRLNELVRGAYFNISKLYRAFLLNEVGLGKGSDTSRHYLHVAELDELASSYVSVVGPFAEMTAIARGIGDDRLIDLILEMRLKLPDVTKAETVEERTENLQVFEFVVIEVHEKVYELLEETTETK